MLQHRAGLVVAAIGVKDGGLFGRGRHFIDPLLDVHLVGTLSHDTLQVSTGNGEIEGRGFIARLTRQP